MIFAGSLKKHYVEADYVVALFSDNLFKTCQIDFYSTGNGTDKVLSSDLDNICLKGWVSKTQLEEAYESADVLISIAERNGKQMSSKIFEYMAMRKPIIHFYYVDEDINLKYLYKYSNSLCVKTDINILEKNKLLIALYLLKTSNSTENICFDEELLKCSPEYIYEFMQEAIR